MHDSHECTSFYMYSLTFAVVVQRGSREGRHRILFTLQDGEREDRGQQHRDIILNQVGQTLLYVNLKHKE